MWENDKNWEEGKGKGREGKGKEGKGRLEMKGGKEGKREGDKQVAVVAKVTDMDVHFLCLGDDNEDNCPCSEMKKEK